MGATDRNLCSTTTVTTTRTDVIRVLTCADDGYEERMKLGALLLCLLTACGPSVMVGRMAYFPPRGEDCQVQILNGALMTPATFAAADSPYEIVGTVALGETGHQDPFSERYLAIVRPNACRMGGDAISLMSSQTFSSPQLIRDGTSTAYVILHKRGSAPQPVDLVGGYVSGERERPRTSPSP